jgi:hypothetical protein
VSRLSIQDVREARQASRHLPSNDLDAAHLLAVIQQWEEEAMTPEQLDLFKRAAEHASVVLPPALAVLVWNQLYREEPVNDWVAANWMTKLANDVLSIPNTTT